MTSTKTLSIVILSGKGGVGKSNIALNLSYALHQNKQRVLLLDCDLGLASLDVLMGITTQQTFESLMQSDTDPKDISIEIEKDGLSFIPAASGLADISNYTSNLRASFVERLNPFASTFDYVLLDVGAGISNSVQLFASMAMVRVVVITPEPTSLTDSYALMKIMANNHGIRDFFILVNQTESAQEEKMAFTRLAAACERFLGFTPLLLGGIRQDMAVQAAVRQQKPLMLSAPDSSAAHNIRILSTKLALLRTQMQARLVQGIPLQIATSPQ